MSVCFYVSFVCFMSLLWIQKLVSTSVCFMSLLCLYRCVLCLCMWIQKLAKARSRFSNEIPFSPLFYWEASKWYFVNVERGNIADKLQPRNIDVSFTNNSNVPIDVIIFTFYSDQLTKDVETGIVTK